MNRRNFLLALPGAGLASEPARAPIDVAYAASMASVMEGPLARAAKADLRLEIRGRAQGANGLAQLIAAGAIRPDVFISITRSPINTVIQAGRSGEVKPIARTEMVIAYSPKSRFGPRFATEPWWRVLQAPGIRFGRTDPVTDPQGRNIIFVIQLAAALYHDMDLPYRILGPLENPRQIFTEASLQARLQAGELDAASAYKVQPVAFGLPYISLPEEINLASSKHAAEYARASVTLNGKTYSPEPLIYYVTDLKDAPHKAAAVRFVEWLQSKTAREIFQRAGYGGV